MFYKMKSLFEEFFIGPSVKDLLLDEIKNCNSILDIGCGHNSIIEDINNFNMKIGLDIFKSSLKKLLEKRVFDTLFLADIRYLNFKANSFDCIIAFDVIEHLTKIEGLKLMTALERIARKKIIIYTPNSYQEQGVKDNNIYQRHKSGWIINEFLNLGYKVRGAKGFKLFRTKRGQLKIPYITNNAFINSISNNISSKFPRLAFSIFCVKNVE